MSMDDWQNNTGRTKSKCSQHRRLSQCHFVHHKLHVDCCWSEHGLNERKPL